MIPLHKKCLVQRFPFWPLVFLQEPKNIYKTQYALVIFLCKYKSFFLSCLVILIKLTKSKNTQLLDIFTRAWVLCISNAGQNLYFPCFSDAFTRFWCKLKKNEVLYKLFHSVLDQIISRWITAHYTVLDVKPLVPYLSKIMPIV